MGISERREREKQELREKILEKAREILIKEGQDNLSIRNIATAIEYSPATIYLYFQDKDEIVYELMEMGFERMTSELQSAFELSDPVERIRRIGQGYIAFGLKNPEWYDIMFNAPQPIQHLTRCQEEWGYGKQLFDFLISSCEAAMDQSRTRRQDPRLVALHLWSTVHGLVNLSRSQRLEMVEQNNNDSLIQRTMESMLQCIFQ
ncbi:MAG: TetR/AcrR family transcriptional regulator [Saprospiraceae bacterium]|nr:TetR/AcrR family transcriptional regulator [Saprospiraceae bacterium]MCB9320270.1 TetR/AcrR family transcriptional regulator [Lewinellaceae bacterium]